MKDLGLLVRMLGLNPTVTQLRHMQPLVQDETGNSIVYKKFEVWDTKASVLWLQPQNISSLDLSLYFYSRKPFQQSCVTID